MKFHENRLLADNSHVISCLIFVKNWERCLKICRLLQSWLSEVIILCCISAYSGISGSHFLMSLNDDQEKESINCVRMG